MKETVSVPFIQILGARTHNLKNVNVDIPLSKLTVVCGPSGSGKSSLIFETLFVEGYRRFSQTLGSYERQFTQRFNPPPLDDLRNCPVPIALKQHNFIRSREIRLYHLLELDQHLKHLMVTYSQPYCPHHKVICESWNAQKFGEHLLNHFPLKEGFLLVPFEKRNLKDQKLWLAQLLENGYSRLMFFSKDKRKFRIFDLSDLSQLQEVLSLWSKKNILTFVLIDHFFIQPDEIPRIWDSFQQGIDFLRYWNLHGDSQMAFVSQGHWMRIHIDPTCPICSYKPVAKNWEIFDRYSQGACLACQGRGFIIELSPETVIVDPELSLSQGVLAPFNVPSAHFERAKLMEYCQKAGIPLHQPWNRLSSEQQKALLYGNQDFFGVKGLLDYLERYKYKIHVRVFLSRFQKAVDCPSCQGFGLRPEAMIYHWEGMNWSQWLSLTVTEGYHKLSTVARRYESDPIFNLLKKKISFMQEIGLGYLELNRLARSLSAGEFQRVLLANQLSLDLHQGLYILDEPSNGLHPHEVERIIRFLKKLTESGNTVVVVEHDPRFFESADFIVEIGPGSGPLGGQITYSGPASNYPWKDKTIHQCQIVDHPLPIDWEHYVYFLELKNVQTHNLKGITVRFPLRRLVCVCGPSGSGKSSLVSVTLAYALWQAKKITNDWEPDRDFVNHVKWEQMSGLEYVDKAIVLDHSKKTIPQGSQSLIVTYLGLFDFIRQALAQTPEARAAGITAGYFSLNKKDSGRCPTCEGKGYVEEEMIFLDDLVFTCPDCQGKRYRPEALNFKLNGLNISEILDMSFRDLAHFDEIHPRFKKAVEYLEELSLGYLRLGQRINTLSQGEWQRLRLIQVLLSAAPSRPLIILDEPSSGLHQQEVWHLAKFLRRLIKQGASIICVDHNLCFWKNCDYLIELGPGGGPQGGHVVKQGDPSDVLKDHLEN